MNRGRHAKTWRKWALLSGLMAFAGMGCTPATLWFLAGGADKKEPPPMPLTAQDGKKEITVAILATATPGLSIDCAGMERELAVEIGKRMTEETKEERHPIRVIDQSKVQQARSKSGGSWQEPTALGKQLGADYVLDVTLTAMSMMPSEYGGEMFEGRGSVSIAVYNVAQPGKKLFDYVQNPNAPMKSTGAATTASYRQFFIKRIASDIAYQHVPHRPTHGLPPLQ
jgi:hypothetical protein